MKKRLYIVLLLACICVFLSQCGQRSKKNLAYVDYPLYIGNDLGFKMTPDGAQFTLWAPTAEEVRLQLYDNATDGEPYKNITMREMRGNGAWQTVIKTVPWDKYYTFQIKYKEEWLSPTPGIYARAVGVNGNRAAIVDMQKTNPTGWAEDKSPSLKNFNDIILYEMHFRDFSIDTTSGIKERGKYLALAQKGSVNPQGLKTGIDHLQELGITHLHILPLYDYGSINETTLYENKYNWGYDPKNYNVPEGSYSTDPYTPTTRIKELKTMVMALHKAGIRVVMDVVYNHTFINDGSNFSLTVPGYYYRQTPNGDYSDASACGNETASEREMMRKFMVESVTYWAKEYHIDGFRFDLMGIHDIETMNGIRYALDNIDPTIYIYGEGWTAGVSPYPIEKRAMKINAPQMLGIAVFNDDTRDAIKGSYKDDTKRGFATGALGEEESVKLGIVGGIAHPQINYSLINYSYAPYCVAPAQCVNYVSSHDDLCLVDKLHLSMPKADTDALLRYHKLAQTIVLTSQGVPFLFNGEEIFRNKKGVHNSFESPDSVNQINWSHKTIYKELFIYYKNLIQMRKDHPTFHLQSSYDIVNHLTFLSEMPTGIIAYTLKGIATDSWRNILVVFNGNEIAVPIDIPMGTWIKVCENGVINEMGMGKIMGGKVTISPSSALIAYQNDPLIIP